MSNEFIQVSQDLVYTRPEAEMAGTGYYFSYLPSGASTVPDGQRVVFNIRSSTAFVDYGRSYCNAKIVPTGPVTAPPIMSCSGIQGVFSNITERISGANFDSLDNYNQLAVVRNSLQSATRQKVLTITEGYTGFDSVATAGGVPIPLAGANFSFPIPSNLSTVNKLIPLSLMNSWDLSYALEPLSGKSIFTTANGATGYTIQMEIVLWLVEPSDLYMQALIDNLKEGKTLDLGLTFIKSFPSQTTTGTTNNIQNIVGQLKSCSSLLQVLTPPTGDRFSPVGATGKLLTTQWLLDSKTYPLNKPIFTGPESIILGLSAFNTQFGEMLPQVRINFISFSTGSGVVKSGIKLMSGNVQSNLVFATNPTGGDTVNTYISAEGSIKVGYQGSIVMDYR